VLQGAQGQGHNDFKIPLARRVLASVVAEALGR
jgi:xanthine dehydrogenase YagS FAD-binding subunit